MNEISTHAGNVTTRQLEKVVSLNTSSQYMKAISTNAVNVTTMQLKRVISLNILGPSIFYLDHDWHMNERSIHAWNVTNRQLQRVISLNIRDRYIKDRSTHAGNATTIPSWKRSLTQHQQAIHEGKKCPCSEFDYHATEKANPILHQRAIHNNERSTNVGNVTTIQLKRVVSWDTIKLCMKECD